MTTMLSAICSCCQVKAQGDIKAIEKVFGVQAMSEGETSDKAEVYCSKCQSQQCSSEVKNCA